MGQEQTLLSEILNFSTICHPLMELGEKATHLFQEKRPKTIQLTSTFINRQPDFSFLRKSWLFFFGRIRFFTKNKNLQK